MKLVPELESMRLLYAAYPVLKIICHRKCWDFSVGETREQKIFKI